MNTKRLGLDNSISDEYKAFRRTTQHRAGVAGLNVLRTRCNNDWYAPSLSGLSVARYGLCQRGSLVGFPDIENVV